jgi:hypothetical protein
LNDLFSRVTGTHEFQTAIDLLTLQPLREENLANLLDEQEHAGEDREQDEHL